MDGISTSISYHVANITVHSVLCKEQANVFDIFDCKDLYLCFYYYFFFLLRKFSHRANLQTFFSRCTLLLSSFICIYSLRRFSRITPEQKEALLKEAVLIF